MVVPLSSRQGIPLGCPAAICFLNREALLARAMAR